MSITVQVRQGNLEQAMRVLKKKVQREGIIKDFRPSQFTRNHLKKKDVRKKRVSQTLKRNYKKKQKKFTVDFYKEGIKGFDFTPLFVVYILWSGNS